MRVTHIITRLILGGAQENTIASVLGLALKPGLEVKLISGPTLGPEGSLEGMLDHVPGVLSVLPSLVRPVNPWKDMRALQGLVLILRGQKPDIVHTHSGKAGILGRLAAGRCRIPVILHTIHGPSFGAFQGTLANQAFRLAERYAARVTTHFVVVADAMKQQYLSAGIGRPAQFTRILSGFSLAPFLSAVNDPELRARFGLKAENLVVGKISRLVEHKGHADLFAVAPLLIRQCPQMRFLLVGEGEWRARFEAKIRAAGLEQHFVFAGLVSPEMVARLIGIMDVVVHLSAREGLARALPQALAAGRPIVAYDRDGAAEVCINDQTGFLVTPGDRPGLSARLLQLAGDLELRRRLGVNGQQFVRERFSVEQMVGELHQLYLKLAAPRDIAGTASLSNKG